MTSLVEENEKEELVSLSELVVTTRVFESLTGQVCFCTVREYRVHLC